MSELLHEQHLKPGERPLDYATDFPFDKITVEDIRIIRDDVIQRSEVFIDQVVESEQLTFDTILAPLNEIDDLLSLSLGRISQEKMVHTDKNVRDEAGGALEKLANFGSDIVFNDDLYKSVKAYSESDEAAALTGEQSIYLKKTVNQFRNAGQGLSPEKKSRLQEINHKLNENEIQFGRNLAEDKSVVLLAENELEGTSDKYRKTLSNDDESGKFIITMDTPQYLPFMQQASNREARRKVSEAYGSRAVDQNAPILDQTIALRLEAAELLGVNSWAEVQLEDHMAKTVDEIHAFYDEITGPLTELANKEIAAMAELLHADGYEGPLQKYDVQYYETKISKRDFGFTPEDVAEYFPLPKVLEGLLDTTSEALDVSFKELDIPTWHSDVIAYSIIDNETGEEKAQVFMDLFPREGKYKHACASSFVEGREMPDGTYRNPKVAIIANYTKPTDEAPSLLTQTEKRVNYHEFGHVEHMGLTKAKMVALAGCNTEIDFVESPSQFMEHFVWKPDLLREQTSHYKTGEPMPEDMIQNLVASKNLNVGIHKLRQITLGLLDLAVHGEGKDKNVKEIWEEVAKVGVIPVEVGTNTPATFNHIIGMYCVGYYSYLWSESICDDMFDKYDRTQNGLEYRKQVLEVGGSKSGSEIVEDYLGRESNSDAFFRNLGIAAVSQS